MALVRIDVAASTNTLMREAVALYDHGDVLVARAQTAGRGQRGNSWEAEPGKNLTFSLMLRPRAIRPADAFVLSMAVSVGIVKALRRLTGLEVKLKWPNDVYVGDLKLAGILIENAFGSSGISHSVVGIGLNVNQERFVSDAPNPVSMAMLSGREFDREEVLAAVVADIMASVDHYDRPEADYQELLRRYRCLMWRGEGEWAWHDVVRDEHIHTAIASVALTGHITLATTPPRTYAFKELAADIALLPESRFLTCGPHMQ